MRSSAGPPTGQDDDGDEWLAFKCPTPGCESEGVSRGPEVGFGRCGRCSAIMEVVNPADAQSATKADRRNQQYRELQLQSPPKKEDVPKELRAPRSSVNDLRNWLFSAANAPMTSEILCSWPIGRSFSIFTRRFLTSSRGAYAAVRLSKRRDHKRRIL